MVEHPSVSNVMNALSEEGFLVGKLPVDKEGRLLTEALSQAADEETILFSLMLVNNEIGTIEPVGEAVRILREKAPNAIVHVDAIQAYGKFRIFPKRLGIDLLSCSGHKLHAPKGVGFLYADSRVKLKPILFGGGQQGGMRSGTINVPGIAGLGEAAAECYEEFDAKIRHITEVKDRLIDGLAETGLDGIRVNSGRGSLSAPQIVSISVAGVRSEVLLHALEDKGIYVSSGSACSAHHPGISGTLKGIGLPEELLDATIRVSLSDYNTAEEADVFLKALQELVPALRRFTRR